LKYRVQFNWSFPLDEGKWKNVTRDTGATKEEVVFDDLDSAIKRFEFNTNLARMSACPQRIVDEDGNVLKYYDPIDWVMEMRGNHIMRRAVWRTVDGDRDVFVLDYLGKGSDGRRYVSVQGSNAGVPLDELRF